MLCSMGWGFLSGYFLALSSRTFPLSHNLSVALPLDFLSTSNQIPQFWAVTNKNLVVVVNTLLLIEGTDNTYYYNFHCNKRNNNEFEVV